MLGWLFLSSTETLCTTSSDTGVSLDWGLQVLQDCKRRLLNYLKEVRAGERLPQEALPAHHAPHVLFTP